MAAVSQLSSIVESGRHACYGIEWQLADGILVAKEVYNPSWRIEYAARAGLKRLFTTESTNYTFQPGDGFLLRNLVYVTIMGSIVNIMVSCYANLTLVL